MRYEELHNVTNIVYTLPFKLWGGTTSSISCSQEKMFSVRYNTAANGDQLGPASNEHAYLPKAIREDMVRLQLAFCGKF